MKMDHQHLDFLISQYVDGTLDASNRKLIEQQLSTNAEARQLYKEQRDVQDLLDDVGNRIPLIDWNKFDQTLAARLEEEVVGVQRVAMWRGWFRPLAAAAALGIAATIGYAWHAWSLPTSVGPGTVVQGNNATMPYNRAVVEEATGMAQSYTNASQVHEAPKPTEATKVAVQVDKATGTGQEAANNGVAKVNKSAQPGSHNGTVSASATRPLGPETLH